MRQKLLSVCILLGVLLLGCGGAEPELVEPTLTGPEATSAALTAAILASSEPPLDFAVLAADLETAVAQWQAQNITTYELVLSHRRPSWNTQRFTLTVADGQVTDIVQSCFPERDCILQEVDPQTLTIDALLQTTRNVIDLQDPDTQITFNERLGFPSGIIYSDASWVVDSVTPLDSDS